MTSVVSTKRFSGVFRGYRKRPLARNWLICWNCMGFQTIFKDLVTVPYL